MSAGAPWADPVGVAYILVFAVSGAACLLAIPRSLAFEDPAIRRGLAGLLGTTGIWAAFTTVFFLFPGRLGGVAYAIGLAAGFATVWAWLYLCSAYTGRMYHRNTTLRRLGTGIYLTVVSIKLTNSVHGLYFTARAVPTPFRHLAIEHGPLHWGATGFSYVLASVGLFMLFEFYAQSAYNTRPLTVLTALLALPIGLDLVALATPQVIDIIYAPLGVAAFAIGTVFLFQREFLAVRTATLDGTAAIFLDESGLIRDYSPAAEAAFPELDGATGERLAELLPAVAGVDNSGDQVIERTAGAETRYYLVSTSRMAVGDGTVRVVSLSDVTERERQRRQLLQRERELDQQTELYRAVIAASFAVVFRIDLDERFSFVSQSVTEFLEYTPEELDGEDISAVIPDERLATEARGYLDEVRAGESLQISDFPLETKTGRTIHTDVRAVPIYEAGVPQGERTPADIVGTQLMVQDVTERRQRESLISVMNRVLRHNVRNKLTVINMHAELLGADLDGDPATRATQIAETTDDLLGLSESARRIEKHRDLSPELESIDIVGILTDLITEIEAEFPDATVAGDLPDTARVASLPRIETALWELLENAAKHGGDPPAIEVDLTETEHRTVIAIHDDGPGLPDSERQVLATGTEEPLVHGQGLGLYLAYWLVTNLQGEITIPTVEDGTTIEVRLPKATDA